STRTRAASGTHSRPRVSGRHPAGGRACAGRPALPATGSNGTRRTRGRGAPPARPGPDSCPGCRAAPRPLWKRRSAPTAPAARAPPGWRARLRWPAGASGYWIEWCAAGPRAGVPPGSSLAGFGLRVPGGHRAFLEAHFSADRAGGQRPQLLDLEPPTLALAVHGGAARAGMSVRIVAEVSDDRDPAPRVTLEAVAPAPPGPGGPDAWIVTYSATDASGNRATARTRVPRPAGPTGEVDGTPPAPSLLRLAVMP